MFSSIKNNFFVLAIVLVFINLVHTAQVCRICFTNTIVKFELRSNNDGRLIDEASVGSQCNSSPVSATGKFQYQNQGDIVTVAGIDAAQQCQLGPAVGDSAVLTQCCNIPYNV